MKDIDLALFTGVDIPIPECQLIIHQPTIKEISMIGEKYFFSGIQILTIDVERLKQDGNNLSNTTNFQLFMRIMTEKEARETKAAVLDVCSLLVPNSKITVTPRTLLLNYNGTNIIIDEGNFEYFQDILRQVFCLKNKEEDFNPANEQARKIAEKIKKGKAKVARLKGEDIGSIYARYISSLAIGLHLPLDSLLNCTIYQIQDLLERFSLYTNWDIDIRSRLAGAKGDGKPEDWMRNIHKD